jgi:hypothetical protein
VKAPLFIAIALLVVAACEAPRDPVVVVAHNRLHPEGCGRHGNAIASRIVHYAKEEDASTKSAVAEQKSFGGVVSAVQSYTGTLVTCRDGVVVLVP